MLVIETESEMDEKFNAILSVAIIHQVVDLIVQNEGLDDIAAMTEFYRSATYEALSKEETKTWHFSPSPCTICGKTKRKAASLSFPRIDR